MRAVCATRPGARVWIGAWALAFVVPLPAHAATEWQIRPFVGVTFGGGTTLIDPERASGRANVVFGLSGGVLGDVVGVEMDVGSAPGFFQSGDTHLVGSSRVTTLTWNGIVGPSRRATAYSLRPFFVGGFGVMRARSNDLSGELGADLTRPAFDLGGGVSGALSVRTGLSWDLRYFRSLRGERDTGLGLERLSFWRANMTLVVRL